MKTLFLVIALTLSNMALAQQLYVSVGGSGGHDAGALGAGLGVRASHLGAELTYQAEQRNAVVLADDGAGGLAQTTATQQSHAIGLALLGFAPIGKVPATGMPIELVGRIARERFQGDLEEWRTSIGAGVQLGAAKGLALRLLVQRDVQTTGAMTFVYGF